MGQPRSILVVDDDPDILEVTTVVLESLGDAVRTATNGHEALATLQQDPTVCLILLDLMMPIADGWWLRAEIARTQALAAIPIVVVTGAGLSAQAAHSLGFTGFLAKPVALDTLLATVAQHCDTRP